MFDGLRRRERAFRRLGVAMVIGLTLAGVAACGPGDGDGGGPYMAKEEAPTDTQIQSTSWRHARKILPGP